MAVYCRSIPSPYLRSAFAICKGEQLKLLSTTAKRSLHGPFQSQAGTRQPPVLHQSVLYYGVGGFAAGTLYALYQVNKSGRADRTAILNETEFKPEIVANLPPFPPARKITVPTDNSGLKLTLYQYPTCPFCCKVRAFLDYYGISYNVVEVDPVLRQQIKWSNYRKVPILLAQLEDGSYLQLNDSSVIISVLKTYLLDTKQNLLDIVKFYPSISYKEEDGTVKTEVQNRYFIMSQTSSKNENKNAVLDEVQWRKWADSSLVHVLSPNVYRTLDEALQSFNWFSEVGEWDRLFPSWERLLVVNLGALAMWMIGKRLKKRHMLKEDVRQSLYDDLNVWTKQLHQKGTTFAGGEEPNLADLAVYGVLSSIEGCQAFQDALETTSIDSWYNSMKVLMRSHAGSNAETGR